MAKKYNKTIKLEQRIPKQNEALTMYYTKEARQCILNKLLKDSTPDSVQKICDCYGITEYRLRRWQQIENDESKRVSVLRILTNEQEDDFEKELLKNCIDLKRFITPYEIRKKAKEFFSKIPNFKGSHHWASRFIRDRDIEKKMIQTLMDNGIISKQHYKYEMERISLRELAIEERLDKKLQQITLATTSENEKEVNKIFLKPKNEQKNQEQSTNKENLPNSKQIAPLKITEKIEQSQEAEEQKSDKNKAPSQRIKLRSNKKVEIQNPSKKVISMPDLEKETQQQPKQKEDTEKQTIVKVEHNPPQQQECQFTKYTLQDIELLYKAAQDQLMLAQQKFIQIQTAFYKLKMEENENIK